MGKTATTTAPPPFRVESVPTDSLHLDPANARRHPQRNLDAIKGSLARFGQQTPLVIDADNVCRKGNGTLQAAREMGWESILVVRTPLKGSEATAYAIADNRTAELAAWDDTALAETLRALQSEDFDLGAVGYQDDEVDALIEGLAREAAGPGETAEDPGAQTDRAEELREKWGPARGQLWVIPSLATPGREHRLLCGDSTDAGDVARLMGGEKVQGAFTSPPYAEQRKEQYGGTPADQYVDWWEAVQANVRAHLSDDGSFFVNIKAHCVDGERALYVMDLVLAMKRRWDWKYVDEFAWVRNGVPGGWENRFKNAWEPVHHFAHSGEVKFRVENVLIPSAIARGERGPDKKEWKRHGESAFASFDNDALEARPSNVIEDKANCVGVLHSAPFPVGIPTFFTEAFSDPGDLWFEPFCGSGTTIVAAEQTGRLCYGMELAEKYVAVILERLAGMGLQPRLADAARGAA